MRLSTKLFIGFIIVIFALTTVALFWGRSVVDKELGAVLEGVNDVGTKVLDLESFNRMKIEGPFDIVFHPGKGEHRFTAPKVLLDRYKFNVGESRLDVRTTNPFLPKEVRMTLDLYMEELAYLNISGPVVVTSAAAINSASTLFITASGNAKSNLELSANNLIEVYLYESSNMELKGATGQLTLETRDNSEANLLGLSANSVKVNANRGSTVKVSGSQSLELMATHASSIAYLAGDSAAVSVKTEDDGKIKRMNEDSTPN